MLRALREAAGLLLAAGVLALATAWKFGPLQNTENAAEEIPLSSALNRQPPPLWIDARTDAEYAAGHAPGAHLLNPTNWESAVPGVLQAWEPGRCAVVYCGTPGNQASREISERLRAFHLGPVFILQGGWQAWARR